MGSQVDLRPCLVSDRDRRVWGWICQQVGEDKALAACRQLAGDRRPYPSNLAKQLGLRIPKHLALASKETARAHLEQIASMLRRRDGDA